MTHRVLTEAEIEFRTKRGIASHGIYERMHEFLTKEIEPHIRPDGKVDMVLVNDALCMLVASVNNGKVADFVTQLEGLAEFRKLYRRPN